MANNIDFSAFYDSFYNTFLTTANSLPMNSMWLVFITEIPQQRISTYVTADEGWTIDKTTKAANFKNPKGMILATAVKVVGDSVSVTRQGAKNTGYIQGLVGEGRAGFPLLDIAFVENNVSFVDYMLRPWQVAVSHASLKNQSLKTDIDVIFLSKTGPHNPLAQRKHIKYKNCCPVNIDTQEYNSTGSDMLRVRQIQFAFSSYELIDADQTLLSLIGVEGNSRFFNQRKNRLKNELQRQFGANSPSEYLTNIVKQAKSFGANLIAGTATNIVTNVAGTVQGKINNAINSIEGSVAGLGTGLVNSINNITNTAIGNVSNSSSNSIPFSSGSNVIGAIVDTAKTLSSGRSPAGYVEKTISKDDYIYNIKKPETQVNVNKLVDTNDSLLHGSVIDAPTNNRTPTDVNADTVMLNTTLVYNLIKPNPSTSDSRSGAINHEDVTKKISQADYISNKTLLKSDNLFSSDKVQKNATNSSKRLNDTTTDRTIDSNDHITKHILKTETNQVINQDDAIKSRSQPK